MPFASTWMELEITIQSEVSQTEKDKNELIYKTETDPQIQKQTYSYQRGKRKRDTLGIQE